MKKLITAVLILTTVLSDFFNLSFEQKVEMYCKKQYDLNISQSDEDSRSVLFGSYICISDKCKLRYSPDKYAECINGCKTNEMVSNYLDDHMNCIEKFINNEDKFTLIHDAFDYFSSVCKIDFSYFLLVYEVSDQKEFENVGTCFFNCLKKIDFENLSTCNNLCKSNKSNNRDIQNLQISIEVCLNIEKDSYEEVFGEKMKNENNSEEIASSGQLLSLAHAMFSLL